MVFKSRGDAGVQLALKLQRYCKQKDTLVVGLARGGVAVAYEVAKALQLPLDVLIVRKIGAPGHEELGIGAVTENGTISLNEQLIATLGVSSDYLKRETEKQKQAALKRAQRYRKGGLAPNFKGKTILLVDDGIATGASMRVAIQALRASNAAKIVIAVPVAAPDSLQQIAKEADEIVCLSKPVFFEAVGSFYKAFEQVSDEEVVRLLSS